MMEKLFKLSLIILLTLITACSSSRYQYANDSTPSRLPNKSELKDAIPRAEAYSRGGNKNYKVRGINYQVLTNAKNFEQTGIASWYGKKFHGHLTSNGEIYDMYTMSAAHKNLPLPTYLKVTNLANNKSVIVRVNDRGPFYGERIIDLSYSAAYKLDMLRTGTAQVKLTSITNFNKSTPLKKTLTKNSQKVLTGKPVNKHSTKNYIQVFATSKHELAQKTASSLKSKYVQTVNYPKKDNIYRIQIGPILDTKEINELLQKLKKEGYPNAYLRNL